MTQPKPDICPNCGENELVPHRNAGKRQWKDYPDLKICEACWHKYVKRDGLLIRVKNPRLTRT